MAFLPDKEGMGIQVVLSGKKFKDGVIEKEKMEEREVKKAA
jgi:hypothetical protein